MRAIKGQSARDELDSYYSQNKQKKNAASIKTRGKLAMKCLSKLQGVVVDKIKKNTMMRW